MERTWTKCPLKRLRGTKHCITQPLVDHAKDVGTVQAREDKLCWRQQKQEYIANTFVRQNQQEVSGYR